MNKAAAVLAKKRDSLVILDLGGKNEALDIDILQYIDFLSPNETEIKKIFDMNIDKLNKIFHEKIKEKDIKFKQLCFYVNEESNDILQYELEIESLLTVFNKLKILYK